MNLTFRNMFGHQIRMLGRPFSRSVATGLPGIDFTADSRRHSLRVSSIRYSCENSRLFMIIATNNGPGGATLG